MKNYKNTEDNFMMRIAAFIVDKRNLFFLLVILGIVFSAFSRNWVKVENDLVEFLPANSETKLGMEIMEEQFITLGTAQVMIANITYEHALELSEDISEIEGVQSVTFDNTTSHYNNASALYTIGFDFEQYDEKCEKSLNEVKELLSKYDVYVGSEIGYSLPDIIAGEVEVIMVYVAIIIILVLLLTSQTYAEIPVLLLTFIVAAILNMGTNFIMGTISFVSNSVTTVLQLALSLDYAVILCNRYKEEHQTLATRDAVVAALSKSIPEITASSLTTIGGLFAMLFMQFKIGPDMGINLIKSIFFALFSVFIVMPGLLVLFGPLMDKTKHRNFIPKISFVGKFAHATRYIIPPIFVIMLIVACNLSGDCPYVYGYNNLETTKLNDMKIAEHMIEDNFTSAEMVALVVPAGDYEAEGDILAELIKYDEVESAMGLSNVEAMGGYVLSDSLTPREFAELADLDYELARIVYAAYAAEQEDYGQVISSISNYEVPLIDMFLFVCEQVDSGLVSLGDEQMQMLSMAQTQMASAKAQLQGEDYSRMLVYLDIPEGGDTLYAFLDTMRGIAQEYYPEGDVYVVGNATSEYDFQKTFSRDNIVISVLTILIVLVVLLFTFKSVGMPLLLIMVIQGSIWMNFSVPTLTGNGIFFMTYLIVSAIQMGANIDYAIVTASRFMELKDEMPHKQAIVETMNFAFPTIFISGTIMATASFFIGNMTSEGSIANMGLNLARGTLISIALVMFVLPQLLLVGVKIIEKTSFSVPKLMALILVIPLCGQMTISSSAAELTTEKVAAGEDISVETDIEENSAFIYINTVEDLLALAGNCTLDTWSQGKTVVLQADIHLEGGEFLPIPTFGGTFDGNGHSITGLEISAKVSQAGLFGVVQEGAVIKNINVSGSVHPSGKINAVGGIVGENYGKLTNCSFTGTVSGEQNVGGIAGLNGYSGEVQNCRTSGNVLGENMTGGIVGYNQGTVTGSKNDASVNDVSVDPSISLDDIELDISMDVTKLNGMNLASAAMDTGGVAGYSMGIIQNCTNAGTIGYPHIGYNLGGIVGRSCGYITNCTNTGEIYGRKDVGGIVGQMEPYVFVMLSESSIAEIGQQLNALDALLERAERNVNENTASVNRRIEKLRLYLENAEEALKEVSEFHLTDLINQSEVTQNNALPKLTAEMRMLTSQLNLLGNEAASGVTELEQDLKAISSQTENLSNAFRSAMQEAESFTLSDLVEDTSEFNLEEATYGKVTNSENTGAVYGDMNIGGIAGIISMEYDLDPEDDVTAELSMKERRQYELTAIIYECINHAAVTAKKDYAGGICGRMELGLITNCEGYGYVGSESGDYIGGIAGLVGSTIRDCFAKCTLGGRYYIGGIVGSGITEDATGESSLVSSCYSLVDVQGYQQFAGAIAGVEAGSYLECYFVSEELPGINRTSYEGKAEPITYEELLEVTNLPKAFEEFTLSFVAGEEVLFATTFEYGASFEEDIFPAVPEIEGSRGYWDTSELKNLKKDTVVTAVYTQYSSALASKELREDDRPIFFVEGQFDADDSIEAALKETDFVIEERQTLLDKLNPTEVIEQWSIEIPEDGLLIHTLRYLAPEEASEELDIYVKQDGKWKLAKREPQGSYLLFYMAGTDCEIAVVETAGMLWAWLIGAVLVCVAIGGGVWMVYKKKNILQWLTVVLAIVLIACAVLLGWVLSEGKLKSGVEAYLLLKEYTEQQELAMELEIQAEVGTEELELEAEVLYTELDGKKVTCIEQGDLKFYYAGGILYLENGKAYRASEVSSDYSGLLEQTLLLYGEVDIETVREDGAKTYKVAAKEDFASKLLTYLLPAVAEEALGMQTLEVALRVEDEALASIVFTSQGKLKNAEASPYDITAALHIAEPEDIIIEIPDAVRKAILSDSTPIEANITEDIFRLYHAWEKAYDQNPLAAQIYLHADCGPIALDENVTFISKVEKDTRIHCIRKNDFAVYFNEDTICSEKGYAVTAAKAEAVEAADLLGIAFGLCMNGTVSCTEANGTYIYSLVLDEAGMKEIAATIAPASADMGVKFENGSVQILVTDERIESIRFACAGRVNILVSDVAVAFSAEFDMEGAEKYKSFTIPEKVREALIQ